MKHAASKDWTPIEKREPKHSMGWSSDRAITDSFGLYGRTTYTPGRHAKPFAAHHPARPVTYDAAGTATPLNPPTHALDVAA